MYNEKNKKTTKDPDSVCHMVPSAFNMNFLFSVINSFTKGTV